MLPDRNLRLDNAGNEIDMSVGAYTSVAIENAYKELFAGMDKAEIVDIFNNTVNSIGSDTTLNSMLISPSITDTRRLLVARYAVSYYIKNSLPESNRKPDEARLNYLKPLLSIIDNALTGSINLIGLYTNNDLLIASVKMSETGATTVYVMPDTYSKYLEDNSIDAIIGYGLTKTDSISLDNFLPDVQNYLDVYERTIENNKIRNKLERLSIISSSYKAVAREYISGLEHKIPGDVIDNYITSLTPDVKADIKSTCRQIVGVCNDDPGFLKFIEYMNQYAKMFQTATANEIATAVVVKYVITELLDQTETSSTIHA